MCGIAGIVSQDALTGDDRAQVARLNEVLRHRGPDGEGHFDATHVSLAARRLAIIDLPNGSQPLYNEDRSLVLICNGEIYNHVELRPILEARGHRFQTGSDCETILHLYEDHGTACLDHLRGMFAFSLWDTRKRELFLARDRMGEKPLYLYQTGKRLTFASELKALMRTGSVAFELDPQAINLYFHYQYVPEPATPIRGVRKLPAGHFVLVRTESWSVTEKCYWDMEDAPPLEGEPAELIRAELERISELVGRADVPVGVALSGGLDSSAVAALMARKYADAIQAFTVGYRGTPESDERRDAAELATHLRMPLHTVELDPTDIASSFDSLVYQRDDPIADIAGAGYQAVMKLAREHGVSVVLQGQGGDELFWGYPWVRESVEKTERKQTRSSGGLGNRCRSAFARAGAWIAGDDHAVTRMVYLDETPDYQIARREMSRFYCATFRERLNDHDPSSLFTFERPWPPIDIRMTKLIASTYLRENGVAQGDRLAMASSVELRLPLLDHRLIELVIGLRKSYPDYRLPPKAWLRAAVKDLLPAHVLSRPKRGFTPPVRQWHDAIFAKKGQRLNDGYLVESQTITSEAASYWARGPFADGAVTPLSFKALVLEMWCQAMMPERTTASASISAAPPRSYAPIALFAYKRPTHLQRALESLALNAEAKHSDLHIFCDAADSASEQVDVAEVRRLARKAQWPGTVHVEEQETHQGLAKSIIAGVSDLVNRHGRVIVLEDDLVVAPTFLRYMNAALDRYENDEQVMQVAGYMYPVRSHSRKDAVLLPVTSSWGWATWARAWQHLDPDMTGAYSVEKDVSNRDRFDMDGCAPYSAMLADQRAGKVDSWAIRWYLSVFLRNGLVLYPTRSLVQNIGFDGTGTHGNQTQARAHGTEVSAHEVRRWPSRSAVDDDFYEAVKKHLRREPKVETKIRSLHKLGQMLLSTVSSRRT